MFMCTSIKSVNLIRKNWVLNIEFSAMCAVSKNVKTYEDIHDVPKIVFL